MDIISRKKTYANTYFSEVKVASELNIPYLEYSKCSPFDRNSFFENYFSRLYGGISPLPYKPLSALKRSKTFKLYFDQNTADYSPDAIKDIIKFLSDTIYEVKGASVKAYASVEGDSLHNLHLQRKRAEVLIKALEQYQRDTIPYKLEIQENWPLFYQQLSHKGIDSLSKSEAEWKSFLKDTLNRERWEPNLALQRSAEVTLYVVTHLTSAQMHRLAFAKFYKYVNDYMFLSSSRSEAQRKKAPVTLRKLFGVQKYLEKEAQAGRLAPNDLCSLRVPDGVYQYNLINLYEEALKVKQSRPTNCDFPEYAASTFKKLKDYYDIKPSEKIYGDLVSIQSSLYKLILEKKIPSSMACALTVPDEPRYYHLYLNNLNFLNSVKKDSTLRFSCEQGLNIPSFDWERVTDDSRYYYLLKQVVMEGNKTEGVWRTDWLLEFDLYEFLWYNLENWKPKEAQYFDQEIKIPEMRTSTRRLIKSLKQLCPHQAYGIAMSFHAQTILSAYYSGEGRDQVRSSFQQIERFYLKHADLLDSEEAEQLVRLAFLANPFLKHNEPARFAMNLLERVHKRNGLDQKRQNLYLEIAEKAGIKPKINDEIS